MWLSCSNQFLKGIEPEKGIHHHYHPYPERSLVVLCGAFCALFARASNELVLCNAKLPVFLRKCLFGSLSFLLKGRGRCFVVLQNHVGMTFSWGNVSHCLIKGHMPCVCTPTDRDTGRV